MSRPAASRCWRRGPAPTSRRSSTAARQTRHRGGRRGLRQAGGAGAGARAGRREVDDGRVPRADHGDRAARDAALADWIAGGRRDLVVLAGYMELLSPEFLERFPTGINVHPALLPAFPGLDAIGQALDHGVEGHRGHRSLRRRGRRLRADHPAASGRRARRRDALETREGDSRTRARAAAGGDPPDRRGRVRLDRRSRVAYDRSPTGGVSRGGRTRLDSPAVSTPASEIAPRAGRRVAAGAAGADLGLRQDRGRRLRRGARRAGGRDHLHGRNALGAARGRVDVRAGRGPHRASRRSSTAG